MTRVLQAAVFVVALSVGVQADMGGCQEFSGEFTSTVVHQLCASPVGLCTHGVLTGEVEGTYDFVATELNCDLTLENCSYKGDSIVTTAKGSITTEDTGVIDMSNPFAAPFVTTAESIAGTNRYKNAESVFVATGELNLILGVATGTYTLEVCHGN